MSNDTPGDDLDPTAPETFTSAHEAFAELRETCPVAHSTQWNGFWALLRHADVVDVLRNPSTYITSVQNVVPKVATTGRRPPLHLDPPEHTPYRHALNPFFTPAATQAQEPMVRRVVGELLDPFVEASGGDLCAAFTQRVAGQVFGQLFHLTPDMATELQEASATYNRAVQLADGPQVQATSLELYDLARRLIEMRTAEPLADDITTSLLGATYQGELLPPDLVLGTIRQLLVVGMIAPSVFIGAMVVHLAEHPDLQDRLRADPSLVPAAIEEYLRLFTPYRGFARTARHDVEIGGRLIRAGEPIALVYASANRDEAVFPDGDTFVLDRPNIADHVAFGLGPHRCAGESLARLMLQVTLDELLARTASIQLSGQVVMTRWPEWGTLSVPVRVAASLGPAEVPA
jgi:cytochrome P450